MISPATMMFISRPPAIAQCVRFCAPDLKPHGFIEMPGGDGLSTHTEMYTVNTGQGACMVNCLLPEFDIFLNMFLSYQLYHWSVVFPLAALQRKYSILKLHWLNYVFTKSQSPSFF